MKSAGAYLAAIRVWAGVGHAEDAGARVRQLEIFVLELCVYGIGWQQNDKAGSIASGTHGIKTCTGEHLESCPYLRLACVCGPTAAESAHTSQL